MYGWRGRIGLLVPSINTTMETEFCSIAPPGCSVHSARISGGRHGTPEELRGMEEASKAAARDVGMVEPDVVVYGCTSGSFFEGPEWNRRICQQLGEISGAPTVTTAGSMAACLTAGGHRRVDVVTPYVELTNERLKQFLAAHGIAVGRLGTFDMLDMFDHAKVEPEAIYRKVKEIANPEAEAVFVACTQLRALEVLDHLERDLGKPVYSAVQASAWDAFRVMGVDPKIGNCGSLLRKLSAPGNSRRNRGFAGARSAPRWRQRGGIGMIFMSQSGLTEPARDADWDRWYHEHLRLMASVPGVASAQRFKTDHPGYPPSTAMYSFASAAVFDDPYYQKVRGLGEFLPLIDRRWYRRNLFDGLDAAPAVTTAQWLLLTDAGAPSQPLAGTTIHWLRCVAIDRSTPWRGIAVVDALPAAVPAAVAVYRPVTPVYRNAG